jgi:hypothetical protein
MTIEAAGITSDVPQESEAYNPAKVIWERDPETDEMVPVVPLGKPPVGSTVTETLPARVAHVLSREVDLVVLESPLLPRFLVTPRATNDDLYDVHGVRADQAGQLLDDLRLFRVKGVGTKALEVLDVFFSDLTLDKS